MSDIQNKAFYSPSDREFTFVRVQDVEPILDRNKALQGVEQRSDWGRHVATIPNVILEKWLHEEMDKGNTTIKWGSDEFDRLIARKLSDPEWRNLRTDAAFNGSLGFGS